MAERPRACAAKLVALQSQVQAILENPGYWKLDDETIEALDDLRQQFEHTIRLVEETSA